MSSANPSVSILRNQNVSVYRRDQPSIRALSVSSASRLKQRGFELPTLHSSVGVKSSNPLCSTIQSANIRSSRRISPKARKRVLSRSAEAPRPCAGERPPERRGGLLRGRINELLKKKKPVQPIHVARGKAGDLARGSTIWRSDDPARESGAAAQNVKQHGRNVAAGGSNPLCSTIQALFANESENRPKSARVRANIDASRTRKALSWQRRGWWFKSSLLHHPVCHASSIAQNRFGVFGRDMAEVS
jgi:hypothetical protein